MSVTFIKKNPLLLHFSLVLVGERLVGGPQVLEFLVGVGIVRVSIRVHLLGQLAVRLLDLVLVGVSPHAEDLVEVSPETTLNFVNVSAIITQVLCRKSLVETTLVLNALTALLTLLTSVT